MPNKTPERFHLGARQRALRNAPLGTPLELAVIKAFRKNDAALVDAVYSGVPTSMAGREQEIEVGLSGKSNVVFWRERRGIAASDALVDRIFAKTKGSPCVLSEEDIRAVLAQQR